MMSIPFHSKIVCAHAALLTAALIYSVFNLVAAKALSTANPLTFSVARESLAICVLYGWAAFAEGPLRLPRSRLDCQLFALLGVLLGAFQLCFAVGISLTDGETAALMQCVEPITAVLLGALIGAERLTADKVVSALLAGGGVALAQLGSTGSTSSGGGGSGDDGARRALGVVLLFGQGVGISGYCLVQKRLVRPAHRSGDGVPLLPAPHRLRPLSNGATAPAVADDTAGVAPEQRAAASSDAASDGDGTSDAGDAAAGGRRAFGPVTVTAHAYAGSLLLMLSAAALAPALSPATQRPPPLSRAALGVLGEAWPLAGLVYAVVFGSVIGYSLRAFANAHVDASMLVLYNAVQPPATALLGGLPLIGQHRPYSLGKGLGTVLVMAGVAVSALGLHAARPRARESSRDAAVSAAPQARPGGAGGAGRPSNVHIAT
jgi:drug/metabolite transporter (DMT)-like permease